MRAQLDCAGAPTAQAACVQGRFRVTLLLTLHSPQSDPACFGCYALLLDGQRFPTVQSALLVACQLCDRIICGVGKTLLARAVANRTDACFIRVIGSELVQKYVGEGARMVRELFQMARSKKACLIFFDEVDAIGGARFDDGAGELCQMLRSAASCF